MSKDISKYTRMIILFSVLISLTKLHAQAPKDLISLKLKDAKLAEFTKAVESKTKYSFIYGEDVKLKKTITISVKNKSIEDVLALVFAKQGIKYSFTKSHIMLKPLKEDKPQSAKKYTISGYVLDRKSRETLIGAFVYDNSTGEGTITNEYGFYSLTIPEGETKLRFSYIGCQSEHETLLLDKNMEMNISLKMNEALSEVVVYGDKLETGISATQMGAHDIPLNIMKSTPSLLGETDIMKTIQLMPGVQAGTEGSAGVYVRGGGPDENLILLDGVPLYNVDHIFGFFSVFTPDAIKKVSLFKSSFPARYGGRLSSVIDVRTNDGDMRKYHGTVGVGLLSSKLQFEGPIVKDKTSFNVSARRSYLDLVAKPFMPKEDKFGYYFYDLNAKINHRFNDRSRLYISVYNGKDKLDTENKYSGDNYKSKDRVDLRWGNFMTAVRWNYTLSPKLFSNTTVAYSSYNFKTDSKSTESYPQNNIDSKYSSSYSSGIKDWAYNMDFDYRPLPKHHIKFGMGYLYHRFKPEVLTSVMKEVDIAGIQKDTTFSSLSNYEMYGHEANAYIEDDFEINSRTSVNVGLHASLFNIKGKTYTSLQPRLSARYQLTDNVALKASYTKMSQYIHLLSSYTITLPTDLWVPATKDIRPMQAHQYSLGGYYTGIKGWEFSVEGYYKDMSNVLEYKDGSTFLGASSNWEEKVEMGKGRAMGLEFMAQKTIGKTTGWVAYTLAKSDRKFSEDGINSGKRFPYRYDRRHHISLTMTHKFSEKIDVGASWEFYTGGTTTIGEQKTIIVRPEDDEHWTWGGAWGSESGSEEVNHVVDRNNYRMPNSHRLNIGINFNKKTKRGMRTWNIGVYNVYNAMNPTFLYRDSKYLGNENGQAKEKAILTKVTLLPFIPSATYTYKF